MAPNWKKKENTSSRVDAIRKGYAHLEQNKKDLFAITG
jgi:hypothetical protein